MPQPGIGRHATPGGPGSSQRGNDWEVMEVFTGAALAGAADVAGSNPRFPQPERSFHFFRGELPFVLVSFQTNQFEMSQLAFASVPAGDLNLSSQRAPERIFFIWFYSRRIQRIIGCSDSVTGKAKGQRF